MSQSDPGEESGDDATGAPAAEPAETSRGHAPQPPRAVRRSIDSGAAAAVGAGAALVSGLRALRRGDGRSGFTRLLVGGVLAIVAVAQRRSAGGRDRDRLGVAETDVVDTAPDLEDASTTEDATGPEPGRATGDEASDVVDTSPDVEDVQPSPGGETETGETGNGPSGVDVHEIDIGVGDHESAADASGTDAAEPTGESDAPGAQTGGDHERLGEAAFDEQRGRVPAPQQAFDQGLLSSGAEVFWGVDESDDLVVVTLEYDIIEEADELRYVASSEVDDDERTVRVPDTVQGHWDDVAGGGAAITSGTGLVFVVSDDHASDDLLIVVPEQMADELFEGFEDR